MDSPQPNELPVLQEFHHWLRDSYVTSYNDVSDVTLKTSRFVPYTAIESKFKANNYRFVERLGEAVTQPRIYLVQSRDIGNYYAKVFCILLVLSQGKAITTFIRNPDLDDHRLPFGSLPPGFPTRYQQFFDDFCQKQWEFCAPILTNVEDYKFRDQEILPFVSRKRLAHIEHGTLDQVWIHKDYDRLFRRTKHVSNEGITTLLIYLTGIRVKCFRQTIVML